MRDRIREIQNHEGQNKGEPEPCRTEKGRTRTMQDRIREIQNFAGQNKRTRTMQDRKKENQNHAGQIKRETEPCRTE
jgi:hypothetical protein